MRRKLDKEEYEQQTINMKVHVYLLAHLRLVYHICCLQVFLFFFTLFWEISSCTTLREPIAVQRAGNRLLTRAKKAA